MDIEQLKRNLDNRPDVCPQCFGIMVFKGLGTYECEKCKFSMMDDYGKVREYLEKKPGSSLVHVAAATGVSKQTIRELLKDARIQISRPEDRFLRCEMCNEPIRYGRLCPKCERAAHERAERMIREARKDASNARGFAFGPNGKSGAYHFMREE